MADDQNRTRDEPGTAPPKPEQKEADRPTRLSTQAERDRQNRDDPSRAPESGDRK
jgi:hypothetical protein